MTLQQLRYIVTVAETGNITEAARQLFVSQPSLTNAIRELEKEMQITIFHRTNKGVTISNEGDEFLAYARQPSGRALFEQERTAFQIFRLLSALFFRGQRLCGCDT